MQKINCIQIISSIKGNAVWYGNALFMTRNKALVQAASSALKLYLDRDLKIFISITSRLKPTVKTNTT